MSTNMILFNIVLEGQALVINIEIKQPLFAADVIVNI